MATSLRTRSPIGDYTTTLMWASRDPARWHILRTTLGPDGKATAQLIPYSVTVEPLPLRNRTALYANSGTSLQMEHDGLALRTSPNAHTDAASYGPIAVPAGARYHFSLRYTSVSGKIIFGVVREDGVTWLCSDAVGHPPGATQERECSLDLAKGQVIMCVLNGNSNARSSSMQIGGLTALESDSDVPSKR